MLKCKLIYFLVNIFVFVAFVTAPVLARRDVLDLEGRISGRDRFAVVGDANTVPTTVVTPGFTIRRPGLPDLDAWFRRGATFALLAPAGRQRDGRTSITNAANAVQHKDVVISEILWGIDTNAESADDRERLQWIELYNTTTTNPANNTGTDVNISNWILYIVNDHSDIPKPKKATVGNVKGVANVVKLNLIRRFVLFGLDPPEQYILVDIVSNIAGGGWVNDVGQNGALPRKGTNITPKPLISMYRNINYDDVTSKHRSGKIENRIEQLKAIPSGIPKESWKASTHTYRRNLICSPSAPHDIIPEATIVPRSPFIINEVGFSSTANRDWIELKNVSDVEQSLENYVLSQVTELDSDIPFVSFSGRDFRVPAGGVIVVLAGEKRDGDIPKSVDDHPIARGINIATPADQREKTGSKVLYWVASDFDIIPGESLFILRDDYGGNTRGTPNHIVDATGGKSIKATVAGIKTNLWPLAYTDAAHSAVIQTRDQESRAFNEDTVYRRNKIDTGIDKETWVSAGWTGIGYKRNASPSAANGGTPGYDNNVLKAAGPEAIDTVRISEIMYVPSRSKLPQWIELHNTSDTVGVDIDNWRLSIVNHNDTDAVGTLYGEDLRTDIDLSGRIPPGQRYLIVSYRRGGWDTTNLPAARIKSANKRRTETLLNPHGFELTLVTQRDKPKAEQETVDKVGNLGAVPEDNRRAGDQSFVPLAWELPVGAINEDGDRVSIVRIPTLDATVKGTDNAAWMLFNRTQQDKKTSDPTYYGHESDIGSPGHGVGSVLPVSLSKFRPERLKESTEVVVRWVTESETNNAGFNILRSESRNGEFTKLNAQLITGQGTTSERTVYGFIDKTAKPNVVYYYQIQDVSLDGEVQTLRTTRLKGNVTAADKLSKIWAILKLQDN